MNLLPLFFTFQLAQPTPKYITEAEARWEDAGLHVTVESVHCGEVNAYYDPDEQVVQMCTELYATPELAVFVFNHEMGHAFMEQRGIPNSERGADELAVLMSSDDEVTAGARLFLKLAKTGKGTGDDGEHQAHLVRAGAFLCLMDGRQEAPQNPVCAAYFSSVEENWTRMLMMTDPTTP